MSVKIEVYDEIIALLKEILKRLDSGAVGGEDIPQRRYDCINPEPKDKPIEKPINHCLMCHIILTFKDNDEGQVLCADCRMKDKPSEGCLHADVGYPICPHCKKSLGV